MTAYIECFNIGAVRYGIEDYEDGQPMEEHFFGHKYKTGQTGNCERFRLWRNGGCFGQADTLVDARQIVLDYAKQNLEGERSNAKASLLLAESQLRMLSDDPAHLFRFEEKQL